MLIMFPKHILGPCSHCRELSIYPFLFPYCTAGSETFMTVFEVQKGGEGGGVRVCVKQQIL